MTYLGTKFEVATSKGLGGDTFTRNVTDTHTDVLTIGFLLGAYNVRKGSQEQHIPVFFTK